jgi:hypothetical protein
MDAIADYCDLCDLPKSQCVHGQPPPAPPVKVAAAPKPRKRAARTTTTRTTTARTTSARTAPTPVVEEPVRRRWTPPEAFKPLILTVLEQAGGTLDADDVFQELASLTQDRLRPGDSELTPEGELRWRLAARRARIALIEEGLMTKSRPGVWQLAAAR